MELYPGIRQSLEINLKVVRRSGRIARGRKAGDAYIYSGNTAARAMKFSMAFLLPVFCCIQYPVSLHRIGKNWRAYIELGKRNKSRGSSIIHDYAQRKQASIYCQTRFLHAFKILYFVRFTCDIFRVQEILHAKMSCPSNEVK